jgi:transposase
MFIRERVKKSKSSKKRYIYHSLVESYRTVEGKPRQRNLLSLGKLSLEKKHWKTLANRIEEIYTNQERLMECSEEIEQLAQHYASLLIKKEASITPQEPSEPDYEEVDLNSLQNRRARTIGAESAAWSMVERLGFKEIFRECGFEDIGLKTACMLIAARMVHPGSELATHQWLQKLSALCELAGCSPEDISQNRLYRVSDKLYRKRGQIEKALREAEQELFACEDKIFLYDLTNTYFETSAGKSQKKRYGKSKEKRSDCPLIALGVVYNRTGFPLKSRVFQGNVRDHDTLCGMIENLSSDKDKEKSPPTVVIDAGISTEDNLKALKDMGYEYICVARNRPLDKADIDLDRLVTIRHKKDNLVEALLHKGEEENILFCRSSRRGLKEKAIKNSFVKRFEHDLDVIRSGLSKKYCTKKVDKVHERIGRIKQKYSRIAHFYTIEVEKEGDTAVDMTWTQKDPEKLEDRFAGTYFLRTSRTDLDEKELWETYILLTDAEDGFRSMKSELGLRPNYHQLDRRIESHTFITVLAYHGIQAMQWYLHESEIYMRWETIRELLSSQVRSSTQVKASDNRTIYIRNTSEPEEFHRKIAKALEIPAKPLKNRKIKS